MKKNLYDCVACKDTSWIVDFNGIAKRCSCFQNHFIKEQWKRAGLKLEDLDKTFATFNAWNTNIKELKTTATNYFISYEKNKDTKHNSILLCGNPGSGKTHLCIALANNFLKKGINVVYMPYRDIITSLKQNMIDAEYYKNLVTRYKEAEILLIDDLFKGKINETDINIMFEIVNYRYIKKKPIICSTEYVVERILGFDEGIGSRIYEMSMGHIYEVIGKENNYRVRGK